MSGSIKEIEMNTLLGIFLIWVLVKACMDIRHKARMLDM